MWQAEREIERAFPKCEYNDLLQYEIHILKKRIYYTRSTNKCFILLFSSACMSISPIYLTIKLYKIKIHLPLTFHFLLHFLKLMPNQMCLLYLWTKGVEFLNVDVESNDEIRLYIEDRVGSSFIYSLRPIKSKHLGRHAN